MQKAYIDDGEQNIERLDKIFDGTYHQNEAIIRFKGNMHDNNTVLRDPTLFRIIEAPHPLVGEKVHKYGLLMILLHLLKIVLTGSVMHLRTKEYELRNALYRHFR